MHDDIDAADQGIQAWNIVEAASHMPDRTQIRNPSRVRTRSNEYAKVPSIRNQAVRHSTPDETGGTCQRGGARHELYSEAGLDGAFVRLLLPGHGPDMRRDEVLTRL